MIFPIEDVQIAGGVDCDAGQGSIIGKAVGEVKRGTVWGGLVAPKSLPADVRAKLQTACAKAIATEGYKASANRLNSPLVYRDAATFTAFAVSEAKVYAAAVREFGLEEK